MQHLKKLYYEFSSKLKPAQHLLADTLDGTKRIQALSSRKHLLVYTAGGEPVRFKTDELPMRKIRKPQWYDPRTGNRQKINRRIAKKEKQFTPPSKGDDNDWVLILRK